MLMMMIDRHEIIPRVTRSSSILIKVSEIGIVISLHIPGGTFRSAVYT